MNLSETNKLMESPDYQDRFKAEYFQLDIRINGLEAMLVKYKEGTLPFTPKCEYSLLDKQLLCMKQYRSCLEIRAQIEGIEL